MIHKFLLQLLLQYPLFDYFYPIKKIFWKHFSSSIKMRHLLYISFMFHFMAPYNSDCVIGETWYEKCRRCECKTNKKPQCVIHSCNSIAVCPAKMMWMNEDKRCYCDRALQHSVCVDLTFQSGMRGNPCEPDTFVYDSCTLCICQGGKTACVAYANCFNPRGGICIEGETIIDNCFNCTCTHTRFLVCTLIEKCWTREHKPGKCPNSRRILFDLGCIVGIDQECHFDYECPDDQKCCQVSECSFRCQKAVIN